MAALTGKALLVSLSGLVLFGQAMAQTNTHRWRDCHQNARNQSVCRDCWLAAGKRHCTQARVVAQSLTRAEIIRIGTALQEGER